ncbi:MAG: hypothetical protein KJ771_01270, partial [Nanoarchaeota archaeon]|nr:hypothetical protein [Nanoarchaeota archaeon]
MELDLTKKPLVVEVYLKDGEDKIHLETDETAVKKKFDNCSVRKAVDYVLDHYVEVDSRSRENKRTIEGIVQDDELHFFDIYGNNVGPVVDSDGNITVD